MIHTINQQDINHGRQTVSRKRRLAIDTFGSGLILLCLAGAVLFALMSNTATVVMLLPLTNAAFHKSSISILIAIAVLSEFLLSSARRPTRWFTAKED